MDPLHTGPSADLSEEILGSQPPFVASTFRNTLDGTGYVEHEFVAAGTATSYRCEGELSADGRWTFAPDGAAPFRTRVLVRRPVDTARFSGTVVVEWLNVSGGLDADPDWIGLHHELVRNGDAWVGVSAQLIGAVGGAVLVATSAPNNIAGRGLRSIDPERYGTLEHPGDGFAFDIFTQVARAVRDGSGLGGLRPEIVVGAGESQSAIALVTYLNGVHPLARAFDGYLVHSRGARPLPLASPGEAVDIVASFNGTPTLLRDDLDVPVLELQAEGDVFGPLSSVLVRQPDHDRFRLWEVAGAAHADTYMVGPLADTIDCGAPINSAPMHLVTKAAFRTLDTWVRTGSAPPSAPRLSSTDDDPPQLLRDDDGIALGGIRTAPVDVPVDVLSGEPGPTFSPLCMLLGTTIPLSDDRLKGLYGSRSEYEQRYRAAVDDTIRSGFVLEADRDALLGYAQPDRVSW